MFTRRVTLGAAFTVSSAIASMACTGPSQSAACGACSDAGLPADDAAALPVMPWPFAHTATPNGVVIHTDGGDVYASLGPWGSHFPPNSGHAYGDQKSDSAAFFTRTMAELSDVNGAPCRWGQACVIAEEKMVSQIPSYIAPVAGTVFQVDQDRTAPEPRYYPTNLQYVLRMQAGGYVLLLGHLGSIAPGLREKIRVATCARGACIDVGTWKEFGTGAVRDLAIAVEAGEALATPNVAALPVIGKPGYYTGSAQAFWPPWMQIEFSLAANRETICNFDAMDPAAKAAFQAAIDYDMSSPDSVRYGNAQATKWQWGAEARACNAHGVAHGTEAARDFGSLHSRLGAWWRLPSAGGTAPELLAFVSIAKDTAAYDPKLYASTKVDSLITRTKPQGATEPYRVAVPGLAALEVNRLNGELLEEGNGALLVHWRDVETMAGRFEFYQRAAYALGANGLMVRWGAPAATVETASVAALSASDTCDAAGIDCYDHNETGVY